MPQMFPLLWLILFLTISFSLLIMTSIIHSFSSDPSMKTSKMNNLPNLMIWKW